MNIEIFKNPAFGEIRTTVDENNTPWFVGKDVAMVLGYSNTRKALIDHVEMEDKVVTFCDSLGGKQKTTFINESGLYALILSSKLPQAKQFKHWVTSDVLPSIRQNGSYSLQNNVKIPKSFAEALYLAAKQQEEIEKKNAQIEEQNNQIDFQQNEIKQLSHTVANMEKKVSYLDKILACPSTIKVKTIAQDYGMSAIAFNNLLHKYGVQYRCGDVWVLYAKYLQEGYVKDVPFEYTRVNGTTGVNSNMQWTQKGRMFIYEFLKEREVLPLIETQHK